MAKALAPSVFCYFEGEKKNLKFKALYCQPSTALERVAIVASTLESTQATHTRLTTAFTLHSTKYNVYACASRFVWFT